MASNLNTPEIDKKLPKVSFIIPTLNASKHLEKCLKSVVTQAYSPGRMEVIIVDGGSIDNTQKIAIKYHCVLCNNARKTSESGKAVGIKHATGDFIIFVDADNILPHASWLKNMLAPLIKDSTLVGSEPLRFTYRKEDGYIDRYCALMGLNDPFCFWLGAYDRLNTITGKWTGLPVKTKEKSGYLEVILESGNIPTIGANGTVLRKSVFLNKPELVGDYYFDTDLLETIVKDSKNTKFAKVDESIIHEYCGSSLRTFAKKQLRRVKDYLSRRSVKEIVITTNLKERKYNYGQKSPFNFILKITIFAIECLLIFPLIFQAARGFLKKPDLAWFAHPLLCWITLVIYARSAVESVIFPHNRELARDNWTQN